MDLQEQLTKQAGEIGELRGKLDALATKDFVREQNAAMLKDLTDKIDNQTQDIRQELKKQNEFRTRILTIGTVIAVLLSMLLAAVNVFVAAVGVGLINI